MTPTKQTDDFYAVTYALRRSIPEEPWPTTYGPCPTTECTHSGRGAGRCVSCLTAALSALVGEDDAKEYIDLLRRQQALYIGMKARTA
jgi:hypothetical protein